MHDDTKKYKYEYFVTYLGDGAFNKPADSQLRKWLDDGYKALREVVIGNSGYVLFVLSKQVEPA